jgi:polysaccharide deacetylase family protein (PEP-CTERM system associated)
MIMALDALSKSHPLPWRCVSIDVEEYFHIEAAFDRVGRSDWGRWPSRVERNIDLLLSIFNRHSQHGTFFILGDVARRHPLLARRIADAGHEVASHGSMHDRLHRLDAKSFRLDLVASKSRLEDQTGKRVLGYRAPTFSIVAQTAWAVDVLAEEGFEYDASIFPVRHPWYGVPAAPDRPFYVQGRPDGPSLLEVPPLTWVPPFGGGRKLAVAGGGYFRLLPLGLMKLGLAQAAVQKRPAVLYFHPWEFDPLMPRMPLTRLNRLRTYKGLGAAVGRLERIMKQPARWSPIGQGLDELRAIAEKTPNFCLSPGH